MRICHNFIYFENANFVVIFPYYININIKL